MARNKNKNKTFKMKKRSATTTRFQNTVVLSTSYQVTIATSGANAFNFPTIPWQDFFDYDNFAEVYHYFVPKAHRLSVILNEIDARYDGVLAFYPIDAWSGEANIGGTPSSIDDMVCLAGSVRVQYGSRNVGPWSRWPRGVPQINMFQARGDECGSLLGYASNASVCQFTLILEVKMHLWNRFPYFLLGKTRPTRVIHTSPVEREMIGEADLGGLESSTEIIFKKSTPDDEEEKGDPPDMRSSRTVKSILTGKPQTITLLKSDYDQIIAQGKSRAGS